MADAHHDAVVVGSGPNGLAAAITLARAGHSVLVAEAKDSLGGGCRSAELTLPGFVHDVCSAIHPLGVASRFFRGLPLDQHGLRWIHPQIPLAHPFDDGTAAVLDRSVETTAASLGPDGAAYKTIMKPLVTGANGLIGDALGPLKVPRHPIIMCRFGLIALHSMLSLEKRRFTGKRAGALLGGCAAHAMVPLDQRPTASYGVLMAVFAHAVGWPMAHGGSQAIIDAMASYLRSLGGETVTGRPVETVDEFPDARALLLDITPRQVLTLSGKHLPGGYRRQLSRFRYGPAVYKIDWALDGPIPWRAPECRLAGTVHVGGTLSEIALAEAQVARGQNPEKPFVLVAQQSLFDPSRAPNGKHTGWAYCHVPNGSTFNMTERIEAQIERFAPGFRDLILERHVFTPADFERYNANYIGGDINGGLQDLRQLFTRPAPRLDPYATPNKRLYICSSSTPPGGGVHGLCGFYSARSALRRAW